MNRRYPKRKAPFLSRTIRKRSRYVRRVSEPLGELKFFDTGLSFLFDATGEVPATGQLTLIPQGVTEDTRVGRKCVIRSVQMRGSMEFDPVAASGTASVYLYLILDKQANSAAAGVADVFTGTDLSVAFRNLSNSSRFVIMKKWVWVFNSPAGVDGAYSQVHKSFDFYKRCNIPIEYSSTTGAITEITSNNLFLMAGATDDDKVTLGGNCRLRFSDK